MVRIVNARIANGDPSELWDIAVYADGTTGLAPSEAGRREHDAYDANGRLVAESLCHAHVHLDKCFLLQDEKYADLQIEKGDFPEAMELTGKAKQRFQLDDLLRRGRRLISESVDAGATAMRAFVEVDEIVRMKCVSAATILKEEFVGVCDVQICAFAQLALFSGDDGGSERRELLEEALAMPSVDAVGATPYVEDDVSKMQSNITWTIEMALKHQNHLDFHLDYNTDPNTQPKVGFVIEELKRQEFARYARQDLTVCLGHCTRLTLFTRDEWIALRDRMGDLADRIFFVGLPTSDLFMMGRPSDKSQGGGQRPRATLQIPQMVNEYGLRGAISINNVGNAFTPWGSCDPLSLASLGVGVYQAGTKKDTALLYHLVSLGAKQAIGIAPYWESEYTGDFCVFNGRTPPKSLAELVYNPTPDRELVRTKRPATHS